MQNYLIWGREGERYIHFQHKMGIRSSPRLHAGLLWKERHWHSPGTPDSVFQLFPNFLKGFKGEVSCQPWTLSLNSTLICVTTSSQTVWWSHRLTFLTSALSDQGQVTWSAAATGLPLCNRSHRLFPHRTHAHLFNAIINTGELNQNGSPLLLLIGRHLSTHAGVVIPLVVSSPDFTAKKKRQKMVKGIGVTSKWR